MYLRAPDKRHEYIGRTHTFCRLLGSARAGGKPKHPPAPADCRATNQQNMGMAHAADDVTPLDKRLGIKKRSEHQQDQTALVLSLADRNFLETMCKAFPSLD